MESLGIASVGAITFICYLLGMGLKAWELFNDRKIPVCMGIFGVILGVVGMYVMPDFPAHDIITALAVGGVSGLAATGIHQAFTLNSGDAYE